ncbi:MAG: methyltransferase family protein [Planctomycetota bacterium]
MMGFWHKVTLQAKKEYSGQARMAAMFVEGIFILIVIPACLLWLSLIEHDSVRIITPWPLLLITVLFGVSGLSLSFWTAWVQYRRARGTPVPVMATKKLLTCKPYSFCRNPMALGAIVFYSSISVFLCSYYSGLATLIIAIFLIIEIKIFEEKEMLLRFGQTYIDYKSTTPFMIPFFCRWKKNSK